MQQAVGFLDDSAMGAKSCTRCGIAADSGGIEGIGKRAGGRVRGLVAQRRGEEGVDGRGRGFGRDRPGQAKGLGDGLGGAAPIREQRIVAAPGTRDRAGVELGAEQFADLQQFSGLSRDVVGWRSGMMARGL